jgi:hypothetical protein
MDDLDKIAHIWQSGLQRGRVDISVEAFATVMRLAVYGRMVSPDPKPPDHRQTELDLVGGRWRPRPVTISVS